jgi:chitin disaccharide deacetylase
MKTLIVNADDFGRSDGVNRGVEIAHENGVVTSASLMVTRPAADEAAKYARRDATLSVGLHVDLGEWVYRDREWHAVLQRPSSPLEEVPLQLQIFRDLMGRDPTHLDSHQHAHRDEPAATVLANFARELRIPLRGHDARIVYCGDFYGQTAKGEPMHGAITVAALLELIHDLPDGVTELGCHPGVATDDDLPYGRERTMELEALCHPHVRELIEALGIELASFADMAYA